jgi:hypothetical protein
VIVALALLLAGGTATAAVITLTRSQPLTGTLAHGPSGTGRTHYRISVFPYMAVGWSGWCSSVTFERSHNREATEYGCSPVESSGALLDGAHEFGAQAGSYSYGIVSASVASVHSPDGRVIVPVASPTLPAGMRAYFTVERPFSGHFRGFPKLFDGAGRLISEPQITRANAVEHLPQLAVNPRDPGAAPCAVRARPLPHLAALSETLTTPVAWPRPQPGAFLACANATFRLAGSTLGIAVLVDAADARRPAPPLPGLTPERGRPGLLAGRELGSIGFPQGLGVADFSGGRAFNTTTAHQQFADHDLTARRAGNAWVVAEGGTPAARATLLARLSVGR